MAADDNADRAYKSSRRAEVEANLDAIFEETLREYADEADTQDAAASPEDPAAAPAASAPQQQQPSAKAAPAAGPAASPAKPAVSMLDDNQSGSAVTDVVAGIARGVPKFAADVADNMSDLLNGAADYFGLPDANNNPRGGYRDLADQTMGVAQTGLGRFAEDATGEVVALVPVLRGLKAAGMIKGAGQLFAADFAVTALGSNKGDQTLSGQAAELAGVDNWFTDIIKNNPDDSTAERMIRTGLEGAFIGKAFDKAVDGFKYARSWIKGRQVREAIAANSGEILDEGVETAAATVAQARSELTVAQAARESLDGSADDVAFTMTDHEGTVTKGPKVATPEEAAALKGEPLDPATAASDPAATQPSLATAQVREALDAKITQLESTVSTAEADLAAKAQASPVRGEVLENIRQELDAAPGGNPPELNQALGRAADQRVTAQNRVLYHIGGDFEKFDPAKINSGSGARNGDAFYLSESSSEVGGGKTQSQWKLNTNAIVDTDLAVEEHPEAIQAAMARLAREMGLSPGWTTKDFIRNLATEGPARSEISDFGIKAIRAGNEWRVFDPDVLERVRPAATARVGIAGNHLELTSADAARFKDAVVNGDFDEASDALANTFDRRNYNRMSSPEGLKDIIAGLGHEFAQNEKSFRMTYERSLDATERLAKNDLERFAKEVDGNPEAIAARFKELFPDLELDRALTGYRMFEAGLAKKLDDTADLLSVNPGDKLAQEEFARLTILLANVNDHLSGVTSAFGRAQSSGRIEVSFEGIDRMLDVQRKAFMDDVDKTIDAAGGSDAILKAAESVRLQGTRRTKLRQLRKSVERQSNTLGDVGYAFTATNMLSSFPTHTTNVIGPLAKTMIFDPAAGISAGGLNWATGGGSAQFARELHFFRAKWRALTGAFSFDSAVRQASPLRAGIRRAFREGQRATAPNGNTILGPGERNSLRAIELARTFKAGLPIHKPFSGFSAGGPSRVRLLGSSKFGPKMGAALEAQAEGNLRLFGKPTGNAAKDIGIGYGAAAKVIDFAGRIQSWPRHMIAAGDELVAGLNYRAKLEADAYAEASTRGLTGQAHLDFVNDTIDNAARWMDIAKGVDPKDADALARVEFLQTMDKSANNYVDEAAFSQPPGFFTNRLLELQRRMPALRWFTFFARTGANIARVAYNTSLPGSAQQLATAKTREEASLAAAKVAINLGIVYKTFEAISEGHLTGSGPINKAERDIWLETHEPYSFWVQSLNDGKGGWVSYARLDPFATQIQVIAEFADALSYTDDAEGIEISQEIMERMGRLIGSKTYFQGISDFFSLLGGQRSVTDVGLSLVKDFVPQSALLRNIRRAGIGGAGADPARPMIDEGQGYEINDAGEVVPRREGWVAKLATQAGSTIQSEIPGPLQDDWADLTNRILDLKLDRRAYPQRDFFGNVMTYPPAFGPDNFSGLVQTPGKEPDPVVAELIKQDIGFNIKERLGMIRGVELTPEQMDYFHRQFANPKGGVPLHDLLAQRIADPRYQAAGSNVPGVTAKARRKKLLEKWISKREKEAEKATFEKFPALRAQIAANAAVADQMNTQEGSAAVKAEIDARKSAVLKALQEKLE